MTVPKSITIRDGAAYIRYSDADVANTNDIMPTASVAVDVDREGAIVGIEILDVASQPQVETARRFASDNALSFPTNLLLTPQ